MAERDRLIAVFLERHGWDPAARRPLAGDASFRRYERLVEGERRAVLMDAPPPQEDVRPFVAIARWLGGLGYSAPEILAEDPAAGLLLLEDLGDDTYTRVLATAAESPDPAETEPTLYALAIDLLIDLHRRPATEAVPPDLAAYDTERLVDEAMVLADWYLPEALGRPATRASRDAYAEAWRGVFADTGLVGTPTLVLRDYHVDNLIWRSERPGLAACALLDFQDAVAGHPAYDLMSLLEDARRDIAPSLRAAMLARYFAAFDDLARPGSARDAFMAAFAALAAGRHAKVIGIFTRLWRRDAKPDYLVHIPRVWALLERALEHPALAPVAAWFAAELPPDARRTPVINSKPET